MLVNVFAYTALGSEPDFVSLNRRDTGDCVLTARQNGVTVEVDIPQDEFWRIASEILQHAKQCA